MSFPHLFEFMDLSWLPSSLRATLREILECGNTKPFRPYYQWAANEVLRIAQEGGYQTIVELGAGTAPITRHMARDPRSDGLRLIVCDTNPDRQAYEALEKQYPGKVKACYKPIDFSDTLHWEPQTLLFLSGTFHHIPPCHRFRTLTTLTDSAERILILEPLRKTFTSALFVFGSVVPALLLPLWFLCRPGMVRRFLWCWLLPFAPLIFWWDGLVTCTRLWTDQEWEMAIRQLVPSRTMTVESSLFCQLVVF